METHLEEVVFCLLKDHNSGQRHDPRGNIEPFREAFGKGLRGRRHPAPDEWEPTGGSKQRHR
eukprot:3142966-Alexandrium_andersonii.AAC.1